MGGISKQNLPFVEQWFASLRPNDAKSIVLGCARRGTVPDTYSPATVEQILADELSIEHERRWRGIIVMSVLVGLFMAVFWFFKKFDWYRLVFLYLQPFIYVMRKKNEIKRYQEALHFARTNQAWRKKPRPSETRQP